MHRLHIARNFECTLGRHDDIEDADVGLVAPFASQARGAFAEVCTICTLSTLSSVMEMLRLPADL
jgi:hypothetical protein